MAPTALVVAGEGSDDLLLFDSSGHLRPLADGYFRSRVSRTAEYIAHKLERLRAADLDRLILCLDANRDCGKETLPERDRVIRFHRRVDPLDVLAIIEPG